MQSAIQLDNVLRFPQDDPLLVTCPWRRLKLAVCRGNILLRPSWTARVCLRNLFGSFSSHAAFNWPQMKFGCVYYRDYENESRQRTRLSIYHRNEEFIGRKCFDARRQSSSSSSGRAGGPIGSILSRGDHQAKRIDISRGQTLSSVAVVGGTNKICRTK